MPVIQINLVKGREDEVIEQCIRNVAKTVSESLNAPIESVRVMVNEIEPNRFAVGTKLKSDK